MDGNMMTSRARLTVDDYLPLVDLTVERALELLPAQMRDNYGAAYEWFMGHSGTVGSRMWGERIPGVSGDFSISAMRGIHVPSGSAYAVSVTVKSGSIYSGSDRPLIVLPDGTWLLEYAAHRGNSGGVTISRWNDGLRNCLVDGIPVGVFIEEGQSRYMRYLAFVEEYDRSRDVFTLHGPVTVETMSHFSSSYAELVEASGRITMEYDGIKASKLEEDRRRFTLMRRVRREGQAAFRDRLLVAYAGRCAFTGCDVEEVLQAAHIIGYRGNQSNVVPNGLLLRADVHLLYDSSLISVEPDTYRMVASRRLADSPYGDLSGREITLPEKTHARPSRACLEAHFKKFLVSERIAS